MRRKWASSLKRRAVLSATAALIALVASGGTSATASTNRATINTFPYWMGGSLQPFGCRNTTTYGQTITVPDGLTHLNKFTFAWVNHSTGTMVVRAEVYAWDGSKATGLSLYEEKRTISFPDDKWHKETFEPDGIGVTPGAQYVLFASIDKDFRKCTDGYILGWKFVDDEYNGGAFVYQNNHGHEVKWTTEPWIDDFVPADLAFKAFLSDVAGEAGTR
jgi:hypothetical protein